MAFTVEALLLIIMILISLLFYVEKLIRYGRRIINRGSIEPRRAQLPPGPVPWPMVGCIPQMLLRKPVFRWIHGLMEEMDTDIACIRLGNVHVIMVSCPKIALEFLKQQDEVFASRPLTVASHTVSGGYKTAALSPYGKSWKKMRKVLVLEVVSPARHRWLYHKRTEEADILVRYIYHKSKSFGRVNVRDTCQHYAGNVIRRLMFDRRYFGDKIMEDGGPTFMEEEHVDALFTSLKYLFAFCISDYLPYLAGLDLDGHENIVREANRTILKYHEPIIMPRIEKWRENDGKNFRSENDLKGIEPHDLLDVLISLKDADGKPLLTPEEITAQTTEMMIAAVDNPSRAVEWAMAEMINNPKILNKAVEELDEVVGKERLVQEHDIPNLNYIKACAREAFRLHPLVPFNVPHVSMRETVVAGYRIPNGSHVHLCRVGLGRNPKVWERPLEFEPERHLEELARGVQEEVALTEQNLRMITFSTGRRGCVATALGTTMTVMLLARMVQGFRWMVPPDVPKINLEEAEDELCLADPLVASAEPRLPLHLYP